VIPRTIPRFRMIRCPSMVKAVVVIDGSMRFSC
jgi:hypothetical protein